MINTMEMFSGLGKVKIEGIDNIAVKYKTIVDATKKKNYDILDHRKAEFDTDYVEFRNQIDALRQNIQTFMDNWFSRSLTVCLQSTISFIHLFKYFWLDCKAMMAYDWRYVCRISRFG